MKRFVFDYISLKFKVKTEIQNFLNLKRYNLNFNKAEFLILKMSMYRITIISFSEKPFVHYQNANTPLQY